MSPTGDLLVTFIFLWGRCPLELAQRPSCVALVLHLARRSTPFWVTNSVGGDKASALGWLARRPRFLIFRLQRPGPTLRPFLHELAPTRVWKNHRFYVRNAPPADVPNRVQKGLADKRAGFLACLSRSCPQCDTQRRCLKAGRPPAGRVGPRLVSCNRQKQTTTRQHSIMCKHTAPH